MPLRFTVGQLAKLSHLSKQTLIYYDRQGVFCPQATDPKNGYRYYTAQQLEVLDSILILKEIGLSLAEIRTFMAARNEENALAMLRQQQGRLMEKMRALTLVSARLSHKIETLEQFSTQSGAPSWVQLSQPQPIVVQTVDAPGGLLEVDLAIKKLFRKAQSGNQPHFYQIGTMIAAQDLLHGDFLKAAYTFFPLPAQVSTSTQGGGPALAALPDPRLNAAKQGASEQQYRPSGWHLRSLHKGPYERVGEAYRQMLDALAAHGCKPCGFSYEYCVLDSLTTKASAEYVTEIYVPVCTLDGGVFVPE